MPKENIIETNKRTLDSLSPSDKQKIQNSLNESNKGFLNELLNLKSGKEYFLVESVVLMLKNVNNETAPKLKYILKNNKTRNNLLPYEIITAITTEEGYKAYQESINMDDKKYGEDYKANLKKVKELEKEGDLKEKKQYIRKKIEEIFSKLKIEKSSEINAQKEIAFKLFEYIIENSNYDSKIMEEKEVDSSIEALETNDIYKCLIENRSVCSGDAASLSLLLNEIGIQSTHITIADKKDNNGVHEVVSLKIGGEDYICDPTLIRSALKDRNIPKISPRVFLFSPKDFFQIIYKQKEIKYIHTPYKL